MTSHRELLEAIAAKQPEVMAMLRREGFVFDDLGHEPGNWQHLAFTLYTVICEIDVLARQAIAELESD